MLQVCLTGLKQRSLLFFLVSSIAAVTRADGAVLNAQESAELIERLKLNQVGVSPEFMEQLKFCYTFGWPKENNIICSDLEISHRKFEVSAPGPGLDSQVAKGQIVARFFQRDLPPYPAVAARIPVLGAAAFDDGTYAMVTFDHKLMLITEDFLILEPLKANGKPFTEINRPRMQAGGLVFDTFDENRKTGSRPKNVINIDNDFLKLVVEGKRYILRGRPLKLPGAEKVELPVTPRSSTDGDWVGHYKAANCLWSDLSSFNRTDLNFKRRSLKIIEASIERTSAESWSIRFRYEDGIRGTMGLLDRISIFGRDSNGWQTPSGRNSYRNESKISSDRFFLRARTKDYVYEVMPDKGNAEYGVNYGSDVQVQMSWAGTSIKYQDKLWTDGLSCDLTKME